MEMAGEPEFASEMEIYVQSEAVHSYVLLADGDNTVEDVLVQILGSDRAGRAPEPRLYFNDSELEKQKTLAEYGVKLGSVLHLKCTPRVLAHAHERERPNKISGRKPIRITDQPFTIWEKEHNKVLLVLLVEQIRNGGREALDFGKDSWGDMAARFNELTGFKYTKEHLHERFKFYEREYQIVNRIRHHPKFSWDHQRQVVIATDAEWREYVMKRCPDARQYRTRAIPYIDLLETIFADKEVIRFQFADKEVIHNQFLNCIII